MKKKLLISAGIPAVAAAFMLTGCFGGSTADTKEPVTSTSEESTQASETATDKSERSNVNTVEGSTIDVANMFTDRDLRSDYDTSSAVNITLNGTSASSDGDGVSIDGSNVTISKEGIYILTGALDNGTVKVEGADTDKIQIVLNNAVINSDTYAGIYVKMQTRYLLPQLKAPRTPFQTEERIHRPMTAMWTVPSLEKTPLHLTVRAL